MSRSLVSAVYQLNRAIKHQGYHGPKHERFEPLGTPRKIGKDILVELESDHKTLFISVNGNKPRYIGPVKEFVTNPAQLGVLLQRIAGSAPDNVSDLDEFSLNRFKYENEIAYLKDLKIGDEEKALSKIRTLGTGLGVDPKEVEKQIQIGLTKRDKKLAKIVPNQEKGAVISALIGRMKPYEVLRVPLGNAHLSNPRLDNDLFPNFLYGEDVRYVEPESFYISLKYLNPGDLSVIPRSEVPIFKPLDPATEYELQHARLVGESARDYCTRMKRLSEQLITNAFHELVSALERCQSGQWQYK